MQQKRYLSIDVFRGAAIALMVFGNTALMFEGAGAWADHATDYGFTGADLVAPMFIFAIAMTYRVSFTRSLERHGKLDTYVRIMRRYTCLMGIGFLFHPVFPATEQGILFKWGVLAAIGFAGLMTLFFIRLPRLVRLAVAVATLVGHQLLLSTTMKTTVGVQTIADISFQDGHGGLFGGITWFAMMLLGTVVVDDFRKQNLGRLIWYGLGLTLAGVAIHLAWQSTGLPEFGGISKARATPAYALVGLGLSVLLYWVTWYVYDSKAVTKDESTFFQPIAKNSFLLFVVHPFVLVASYLVLGSSAGDLAVAIAAVINTVLIWRFAVWMDRNGHYVVI